MLQQVEAPAPLNTAHPTASRAEKFDARGTVLLGESLAKQKHAMIDCGADEINKNL
jgi:hypothetical protein